ncbi:MAG: D-alanyl-D-alanine carboxypeptidase/D-alanyl-D-alanine-endopeptidase [Bacteroidetes bacterium]|jgi:D-alanyl-D-alanine carboxypeptidase/D-alanyl-D-alanine-endopeptidase (penicillin-binding protein 4)|nr:D-alanyl-D-alanine carboxypeptidase/D-alanyl-D-alanine-endopeptidase [Bacteroidota bacterium]
MRLTIVFHLLLGITSLFSQTSLKSVLEFYRKDKDLQHATYSFCVQDAETGKTIKEFNSEIALVPASTMKIMTTSAALGILGKEYTYKTNFYYFTKIDSLTGATNTHLLIKGSGDPSFNSSYFFESDSSFINALVRKLKTKGLKKITGSLIADASCFDNSIPSTWIWGDIGNYFGAGANGLSYHDNKFSLFYNSGAVGATAQVESISPAYFSKKISLQSNVISTGTEDDAFVFGDPNGYTRKVTGSIPPNKKHYEVEAEMPEPALFFLDQLQGELKKNNLAENGIQLMSMESKPVKYATNPEQLVYSYVSPKLEKIVYYTNVKSNNHYAESLLKTIGAVKSGKQGTTENGIKAIENYWKERGVDLSGLHMADGSGLSRANTITTKIQATVLSKIYRDSLLYPFFNPCLPVAGKNGSMTSLCKGTFAENNLRAKTGYINRARGYCGYVKTKDGKELAFSVLFNNYDCSPKEMKLKIEKFLVALVDL